MSSDWSESDLASMSRAIVLAERGRATVRPNPLVGCVLVQGDEIVGEGWHERPGGPHAEIVALTEAGDRARGATAYVSLEPCSHTGRTGPCTTALVEAGVARVLYAIDDPNPVAAGGAAVLREAGLEVRGGLMRDWAETQNEVFLAAIARPRPHLTLKLAQTADGGLVAAEGRYITDEPARTQVHRLRSQVDAVLVGSGTVLADDPRLDVRLVESTSQPRAVVLDTRGRIPLDAAVVREGTVVLTGQDVSRTWRDGLADEGVTVLRLPVAGAHVDLDEVLAALRTEGLHTVLAEPGPTLTASLIAAGVVDRLVLHVGDAAAERGTPTLAACVRPVSDATAWIIERAGFIGPDLEIVATPRTDA